MRKKSLYDFSRKKFLDEEEIEINSIRDASGRKWFTLNGVDIECDNDVFCNRFDLSVLKYLKVNNDIFLIANGMCNEALDNEVSFRDVCFGYPKGRQTFIKNMASAGLSKISGWFDKKKSLSSELHYGGIL